ncbi:MAG: hypothetical protein F6J93_08945 [Oscillatoria sp. SIO1A7]|nr:hypothetical protein [Oscillatoria sp. SIO1A7]
MENMAKLLSKKPGFLTTYSFTSKVEEADRPNSSGAYWTGLTQNIHI